MNNKSTPQCKTPNFSFIFPRGHRINKKIKELTIVFLSQGDDAFNGGVSLEDSDGFLSSGDDGKGLGSGGKS